MDNNYKECWKPHEEQLTYQFDSTNYSHELTNQLQIGIFEIQTRESKQFNYTIYKNWTTPEVILYNHFILSSLIPFLSLPPQTSY